jgi:hypothetical protein
VQPDVRLLEFGNHLLGIGHKIGREIAAVELHALDDIELGGERFRFFYCDHAFVADLLHRLGDHFADFAFAIRRDRADLGDFFIGRNLFRALFDVLDHRLDGEIDAALQIHRVHAGGDRLGPFAHDRLRQDGGGGGAVAGLVTRLGRDLPHHLRAHILEFVGELDFLGDGDAVLGDPRRAKGFVEHDVAPFRAQGHPHRIGQRIHPAQHPVARIGMKLDVLGCHSLVLLKRHVLRRRRARRRP